MLDLVDGLTPAYREEALRGLASILPPDRLNALADEAMAMIARGSLEQAAQLSAAIAAALPFDRRRQLLQAASSAARHARPSEQVRILTSLAPWFDKDLLTETLSLANDLPRVELRAELLVALLPHL